MSGFVSEFQGMVFQPLTRYVLRYDQTDSSLVPFAPGDQTQLARRVSEHPLVHVETVERGPFSSAVDVTVVTGEGLELATTRELFPIRLQVEAESVIPGSSSYELEGVRHVGGVADSEADAAEANEESVITSASSGGEGIASAVDQVGGLLTLGTVALIAFAVIKGMDLVD